MGKKYDFDYLVIGSGPAGSSAALELSKNKKRVALVEGRFFGGSNLNTRDIPYAVALDFSHTYSRALSYPELKNQDIFFNLPTISAHELKTIIETGGNNKKIFEDAGITCIKGYANLLDEHTVAVNEKRYTAKYFILATGAHLKINEISGTDSINYYTPESIIKLHRLPKVTAVVGGGSTGCEIAEFLAELGVKVILFETSDRLLPREDKEVGDIIFNYFTERLDITALPSAKVVALEQDNFSKRVIFHHQNTEKMVRVDSIVLATGSEPTLDYGLENANIKYKKTGIITNKFFETSNKNIYAIGDVCGKDSSTERAMKEGLILAHNITNKSKTMLNYRGFTRVTKTNPEIVTIGYNEDDLLKRDRKYKKAFVKLSELNISKIHNFEYGFLKLLADRNNHIIGAVIVSPNAELLASEISLAVRHNLTALELASTPHSFNNYSYLIELAAKQLLNKK